MWAAWTTRQYCAYCWYNFCCYSSIVNQWLAKALAVVFPPATAFGRCNDMRATGKQGSITADKLAAVTCTCLSKSRASSPLATAKLQMLLTLETGLLAVASNSLHNLFLVLVRCIDKFYASVVIPRAGSRHVIVVQCKLHILNGSVRHRCLHPQECNGGEQPFRHGYTGLGFHNLGTARQVKMSACNMERFFKQAQPMLEP